MNRADFQRVEEAFTRLSPLSREQRARALDREFADAPELALELVSLLDAAQVLDFATSWGAAAAAAVILKEDILEAGRELGPYVIEECIGRGGGGQVYRAFDPRLNRKVAIKLLPAAIASLHWRKRFRSEMKALAGLRHPHICAVYDTGTEDGREYLVMELLEGRTLAEELRRGRVDIADCLLWAGQLAAALEEAHRHDIVHLDLKPGNVFITPYGVKLLDFGIARVIGEAGIEGDEPGFGGTLPYMAPEQLRGDPVDHRSDIFAFGVLLYEMAAGRRPFQGADAASIMKEILEHEPAPLCALRRETPEPLESLVRRCLSKEPRLRYQRIDEAAARINGIAARRSQLSTRRVILSGAVVCGAGAVLSMRERISAALLDKLHPQTDGGRVPHVAPLLTYPGAIDQPNLSPDGRRVAFMWARPNEPWQICTEALDSGSPTRLTEGPAEKWLPCWSPDGEWIAYLKDPFNEGQIVILPASGGPVRKTIEVREAVWLRWAPKGGLAVAERDKSGERGISIIDMESTRRTRISFPGEILERSFSFSPEGDRISVVRLSRDYVWRLLVQDLSGKVIATLLESSDPIYGSDWLPNGQEVIFSWVRGEATRLWRIPAHPSRQAPKLFAAIDVGAKYPNVWRGPAGAGRMVFGHSEVDGNIWSISLGSRSGTPEPFIVSSRQDTNPQFSPDGRQVVFLSDRSGTGQIWICGADGGNTRRLTSFEAEGAGLPAWSPDGAWIAFRGWGTRQGIWVMPSSGGAPRHVSDARLNCPAWSRDGRFLYVDSDETGRTEIWRIAVGGGPGLQITRSGATCAQVSHDGKFLYYVRDWKTPGLYRSTITGEDEQLIHPEPVLGWWQAFESAVYFLSTPPRNLCVLDFRTSKVTSLIGIPGPLPFHTRCLAVSPDGKRVLFSKYDYMVEDVWMAEGM
jgi:Tol biopolymer transport system component